MLTLNNKIKNGRTELVTDAQMVGNYAYDSSKDKLRRLTANTNGALHVDVHGGATGSGDLKCRTDIADPATSTFVKCNADGTLEMTAELSSAGLATSAKQDTVINATLRDINNTIAIGDGSSNATSLALGYDRTGGKGRAVLVNGAGELMVNLGSSTTQNVNCLGNTLGDGSGTTTHLKTSSDGSLHIISENFDSMLIKGVDNGAPGTQRDCKQNSNGDLRSALIGNTSKDGSGTNYYVLVDSDGKLETSGGGGGGAGSTTYNDLALSILKPTAPATTLQTNSAGIDLTSCSGLEGAIYLTYLASLGGDTGDITSIVVQYSHDNTNWWSDAMAGFGSWSLSSNLDGTLTGYSVFNIPVVSFQARYLRICALHTDNTGIDMDITAHLQLRPF